MGVGTVINAAVASFSRSGKGKLPQPDDVSHIPEMDRRPLLTLSVPTTASETVPGGQGYGSTSALGRSSARSSPERYRRESLLGRVPEEDASGEEQQSPEADEIELDLEERGYYLGSYKRTVALYTLVPLSSLLVFIFLAALPLVWHSRHEEPPPYPRYFYAPIPELLVSAALWCLSYLLRFPLFALCSAIIPNAVSQVVCFNALYVLLSQTVRLAALPLLHVRHEMQYPLPTWRDPAFHRVWWVALGWALADVSVGIAQGYEQLALYRDVMVPHEKVRDAVAQWQNTSRSSGWMPEHVLPEDTLPMSPRRENSENGTASNGRPRNVEGAIKLAVDKDLDQLVNLKEREELEEIYGVPPIRIPVFVSCLQRIDAFVLTLGMTLILAASYLRSRIAFPDGDLPTIYSNRAFAVTFPLIVLFHLFLCLLHTPPVLRRVGVHTTAYVGFLFGLGSVFTGLGLWGALQ